MKSGAKWVLGVFGVLLIGFIVLSLLGVVKFVPQLALSSSFTPVYCNDPTSLCCVKTTQDVSKSLGLNSFYVCSSAVGCSLTSVGADANIYLGSQNCGTKSFLGVKYYSCDDKVLKSFNTGLVKLDIPKGYTVWADRSVSVNIVLVGQKLVTNLGASVLSDSCTFTPSVGNKITDKDGLDLGISYTVPVGSGVGTLDSCVLSWVDGSRHICGNLEEQCASDSDCVGHTYGNKECNNRVLQTYGCRELGVPSNLVNDGGVFYQKDSASGYSNVNVVTSRCEIKSAVGVQCCGDTDCGSNAVCDKTSWTCKAPSSVECKVASDCKVSTQCDFVTSKLRTPTCTNNVCGFKDVSVGCCGDSNCAVGFFCNAQNTCEERKVVDVACPFECCKSDKGYVDRPCADGGFCVSNVCSVKPECTGDSDCVSNYQCKDSVCVPVDNLTCKSSFFGLVDAQIGVKEECNFWCGIGLKQAEKVNVCVKDYTPLILVIASVLILGGMFLFANLKGKGKGKTNSGTAKSNWFRGETAVWKKKAFWISIIGIGVVFFVINHFALFFWTLLGLIVVFGILFSKSLWKRIKRIFRGTKKRIEG